LFPLVVYKQYKIDQEDNYIGRRLLVREVSGQSTEAEMYSVIHTWSIAQQLSDSAFVYRYRGLSVCLLATPTTGATDCFTDVYAVQKLFVQARFHATDYIYIRGKGVDVRRHCCD